MKSSKNGFSRKLVIISLLTVFAIGAAVASAYRSSEKQAEPKPAVEPVAPAKGGKIDDNLSKVVLTVKNMSCSGCIATIKSSLSGIEGIRDAFVDIAGGKAEVYYDRTVLTDVSSIPKAITASDYPAEIIRIVTAEEIRREMRLAEAKSRSTIASVGGWDIARTDFDAELAVAAKRYSRTYGKDLETGDREKALFDSLKAQIADRLVNEGILLQEISKSGFKTDAQTVEAEFQDFLKKSGKSLPEMEAYLAEAGYDFAYFMKKFETKVLIDGYVDQMILAGASSAYEKQRMFAAWFNNAKALAEVVYYDKEIERIVKSGGASSSCCATN